MKPSEYDKSVVAAFLSALDEDNAEAAIPLLGEIISVTRRTLIPDPILPLIELDVHIYPRVGESDPAAIEWSFSEPSQGAVTKACLRVEDLRAMVLADEDVLGFASYALASECRGQANEAWHPHRFGSARPPEDSVIDNRLNHYKHMESNEEIANHLQNHRDVLVYGEDGAGKTTAATQGASEWVLAGRGLIWLDLTDPDDNDESVAYAMLGMPRLQPPVLVVVENVQANLSAARRVLDLVRQLRARLSIPIRILATGSPAVARQDLHPGLTPVPADGHALVREILRDVDDMPPDQKTRVQRLADGDAAIAGIAITMWREHRDLPEAGRFADRVAVKVDADTVGPDARSLLYKLACLALFEIELGQREIAPAEHAALEELKNAGLVQTNDESYTIGPRSLGRLLVQHAHRAWSEGAALPTPDLVAYDYLQRAGAAQIKATLDKLDLLPVNRDAQTRTGLASVWGALRLLGDSLARRVTEDPRWGDEAASAAFASLALIELDRPDAWRRSAEFVRTRWSCDNDSELPFWVGEPTADLEAFERMRDLMVAEHELIAAESPGNGAPFKPIDPQRACRSWMLGVLLSLEAKAPDRDRDRMNQLIQIAQATIEGGAFYPREAPWVTAQVVLGLCLAGRNLHTDNTVQQACRWLCQDKKIGGAYSNGWQNGVSGKTSDLLTTALCLRALLHAGWQNTEHLTTGYQNLRAGLDLLEPSGQETELSLIVEARLRNGDEWEDLSPLIFNLLGWAVRPERFRDQNIRATRPGEPLSASAKAPFIAVQLWIIIWTTVKRELRELLREIQGPEDLLDPGEPNPAAERAPGQTQTPGEDDAAASSAVSATEIRMFRPSVERLRREIDANITDRARQIPNLRGSAQKPFERNIHLWQGRQRKLDAIDAKIESGTLSNEVLNDLEMLGKEVFGIGWQQPLRAGNQ